MSRREALRDGATMHAVGPSVTRNDDANEFLDDYAVEPAAR